MIENYIKKVLIISSMPRVISFTLRIISYPIMLRAVGITDLGIVIYIGSIISIYESFVDFGITTAVQRELSEARIIGWNEFYHSLYGWSKFQLTIAAISFLPYLGATYYTVFLGSNIDFTFILLFIMIISNWIRVFINFIRAVLTAALEFKLLALMDVSESVFKSLMWIIIAFFFPHSIGLVIGGLILTFIILILGIRMTLLFIGRTNGQNHNITNLNNCFLPINYYINKSFGFLWLRIITRIYHAVPMIVFGKISGAEIGGMVGSVKQLIEFINFPFGAIGNAVAVKVAEILKKGKKYIYSMWDMIYRIISLSILLCIVAILSSHYLQRYLFPDNINSDMVIKILAIFIVINAINILVARVSDFIGQLNYRIYIMIIGSLSYLPLIVFGDIINELIGSIIAYMAVSLTVSLSFIIIAQKQCNIGYKTGAPLPFISFLIVVLMVIFPSLLLRNTIVMSDMGSNHLIFTIYVLGNIVTILFITYLIKITRTFYYVKNYMELEK